MRHLALIGAALAGAGFALAAAWAFGPWTQDPPVQVEAGRAGRDPMGGADPTDASDPARLAAIQAQLERLTAAVNALGHRLDSLAQPAPVRVPALDPSPAIDGDALVTAIERATEKRERLKRDALSDQELLAECRRLHRDAKDLPGARAMLGELLERRLAPADRAAALLELGLLLRSADDLAGSARALQEVVDTHGIHTEPGAAAAYQQIWTLSLQGHAQQALDLASSLGSNAAVSENQRLQARWAAAVLTQTQGDAFAARIMYTRLLEACGDRPEYRQLVEDVRRRLERL